MDREEVLSHLRVQSRLSLFDVTEVRHFRAQCELDGGKTQIVEFTIYDLGASEPALLPVRYRVEARAGNRVAGGNSAPTIRDALQRLHWWDLE
jgi:hypothetical protein